MRQILAVAALVLAAEASSAAQVSVGEAAQGAAVALAANHTLAELPADEPGDARLSEKAVSRKDKIVADVTGVVVSGQVYPGGNCGWDAQDILVLYVWTQGRWVSVVCHPNLASSCGSLRENQRARFQGTLVAIPDVLEAGFDACDPATWYVGPANMLLVTKVTR